VWTGQLPPAVVDQMPYFKAKMHQIRFWLWLRIWRDYSAPTIHIPSSWNLGGPTSKGREGKDQGRGGRVKEKGKAGERKGGMEGRKGKDIPPLAEAYRSTTGPHCMILISFSFFSTSQYSGADKLNNCALYDKSTKFGIDVH